MFLIKNMKKNILHYKIFPIHDMNWCLKIYTHNDDVKAAFWSDFRDHIFSNCRNILYNEIIFQYLYSAYSGNVVIGLKIITNLNHMVYLINDVLPQL
jgi:hypothetical protein